MRTPIFATGILLFMSYMADAAVLQPLSDTTRKISFDTTRIFFGPNYRHTNVDRIYSSATVTDRTLFHLSAGVNVLNTLRGQNANLLMSHNAYGTTASLRTGTPLYVIDGIASRNPEAFYNLNAFEYQNISVINSGNIGARYAGGGLNSAIFLQRKTGENIERPSIEFNSYVTHASNRIMNSSGWGRSDELQQWMFANSIAYAQDFGGIDARVSYSYGRFPSVVDAYDGASVHTTNINLGFQRGRFRARLILDQFARLNEKTGSLKYFNGDAGDGSSQTERFFQRNLTLSYHFSHWFGLSATILRNDLDGELTRAFRPFEFTPSTDETFDRQERGMANLSLQGSSPSGRKFQLTYAVGLQQEATAFEGKTLIHDGNAMVEVLMGKTISTQSVLAETDLHVDDDFVLTFNYQYNNFDAYTNKTLTTGFAFDFNHAFHINILSTGRFRGNYGKADIVNNTLFPYVDESYYFRTDNVLSDGKHIEGGLDFGFINDRLTLSVTYFHNFGLDDYSYSDTEFPPYNRARHLVDLRKITTKGWEIVAAADVISSQSFQWNAKLNWGRLDPLADDDNYGYYANQAPEWRSGLLNQFQLNKWWFSFLIDTRYHGGAYRDRIFGNEELMAGEIDLQMQLRDCSIAYTLVDKSKSKRFGLNNLMVSLSGRNMWTLYSSFNVDTEDVINLYTAKKNISLSITAKF